MSFLNSYNVVALYSCNNTLKDYSRNSIDLNGNNIVFGTDRFENENSALFLNHRNHYPSTSPKNNTKLNLSKQFTISLWIKPILDSCLYDREQYIDVLGRWGGTGENKSSYSLVLNPDSTIQFRTYNTLEGNTWLTTKEKIDDEKWNNIVITRDKKGILGIYINGKIATQGFIAEPQASNYELYIGKRRDDRSIFYGYLDDIIILKEVIPRREIKQLTKINLQK